MRPPLLPIAVFAAALFAPASAGTIAVKAKLLIDGTGGPPRRDAVVVIQEGKILAVGTLVPTGATLHDLGDRTILPGLVDVRVRLTGRTAAEGDGPGSARHPQDDAIRGVRNARATLEAGYTTVGNVGSTDYSDLALRDAVREGVVPGPRILAAGPPADPATGRIPEQVRERADAGVDFVTASLAGDASGLGALVAEAHRQGRKVAVRIAGAADLEAAVRAGVDAVESAAALDDAAIARLTAAGTFFVPLGATEGLGKAAAAGVKVALGSDAGTTPHGSNAGAVARAVASGLSPMDAIVAATRRGAELLGVAGETGTVEAGKSADLVVVDGNPLEDVNALAAPAFVMRAGVVVVRPAKVEKKGLAKLLSRD